jgi:hypothetical protein
LLGLILGTGQALQQVSLLYTNVANSAVFTVMYVVIVPFISFFLFAKKKFIGQFGPLFLFVLLELCF